MREGRQVHGQQQQSSSKRPAATQQRFYAVHAVLCCIALRLIPPQRPQLPLPLDLHACLPACTASAYCPLCCSLAVLLLLPPVLLQLGRYWVMKRWELEHLVSIARNNTME